MRDCILVFVKFLENESVIDEQDLSTIEFSRKLKELTGWSITATSMISKGELVDYVSREIYSRGVDQANIVLVRGAKEPMDLYLSAFIAKDIIRKHGCKINVFGERSSDTSFGGLAGYVAGLLNMAYLRLVKRVISVDEHYVVATIDLDRETIIRARLPLILVPVGELYPPSPVSVRDKLEAKKKKPVLDEAMISETQRMMLVSLRKPVYEKRIGKRLNSVDELAEVIARLVGGDK